MEHTPGPWIAENGEDCHAIAWVGKVGIFNKDGLPHKDWAPPEIDARRIVSCVNACEGINTKTLEQVGSAKNYMQTFAKISEQRDELLAVLKDLLPQYRFDAGLIDPNHDTHLTVRAHNAIVKAEANA